MTGRWRVGRRNPRILYRQTGETPADSDTMIGAMDSAELAAVAVAAVNGNTRIEHKLDRLIEQGERTMTALEDLQAADLVLDTEVTALIDEQATFLTDVAAKIGAAGVDPAALAAITADVTAQAQKLTDLAAAQAAADPGAPPAPVV